MSYPRLSEDLYVNYWDLHGHDQGSLLRGVRKGVMASAVSVLLIAGLVTAAVVLSNTWRYQGYTEANQLILTPLDSGLISFVNGSESKFHFSILNRAHGSIDYKVQFDIVLTNTVSYAIYGNLTQTGSGGSCQPFSGTPSGLTWAVTSNGWTGLSAAYTAVMQPGDAGRQCFEASIGMYFNTPGQTQPQDGSYTMDVTAVSPT